MSSSGLKDLSKDELIGLVEQLLVEVSALRERVCALEAQNAALREENARLKGLKVRLKLKPPGREAATNRPKGKRKKRKPTARRAPVVNEEHKLSLAENVHHPDKGYVETKDLGFHQLYRAMDLLAEHGDAIEREVFWNSVDLFKLPGFWTLGGPNLGRCDHGLVRDGR